MIFVRIITWIAIFYLGLIVNLCVLWFILPKAWSDEMPGLPSSGALLMTALECKAWKSLKKNKK